MLAIPSIEIKAITTSIPKERQVLEEYVADSISEKRVKRIIKETGFSHLRIAPTHQSTADFCIAAGREILDYFPKNDVGG